MSGHPAHHHPPSGSPYAYPSSAASPTSHHSSHQPPSAPSAHHYHPPPSHRPSLPGSHSNGHPNSSSHPIPGPPNSGHRHSSTLGSMQPPPTNNNNLQVHQSHPPHHPGSAQVPQAQNHSQPAHHATGHPGTGPYQSSHHPHSSQPSNSGSHHLPPHHASHSREHSTRADPQHLHAHHNQAVHHPTPRDRRDSLSRDHLIQRERAQFQQMSEPQRDHHPREAHHPSQQAHHPPPHSTQAPPHSGAPPHHPPQALGHAHPHSHSNHPAHNAHHPAQAHSTSHSGMHPHSQHPHPAAPNLAHPPNSAPQPPASQPSSASYSGPPSGPINGNSGGPSAHLLSGPPGPSGPPLLLPPALPSNGTSSIAPSRQLAHPPPPPPGAPPAGEEAMVAAIIRDGELSLQNEMGEWRPPTNPTLERLVKETELTWLAAGSAGEALGNYQRAVECYERALRHNPLSAPALTKAAGIYRHQENFRLAADYFSRLLKIHEGSGEIWGALGHCYLMIDDLQKAYTSYQQALHHFQTPKSEPKLWYGIGILYDRYGSLEHAEEAFSSVIKMDPNFEKANEIYFRLGIIYKQQRKAELSLDCFQWILDKPPSPLTEIDIWFQVGHVHEQQGHFDRAKEAYERVLAENATHAKVLQQLGGLYCREGSNFYNSDEAVAILTRSLAADSHDAFSWYLLGRAYMTTQNYNKAYEAYQQAVYRDGKNPAFWCSIGVLYYAIMQFHDSLDAYSRAIRINPYISEVWYNLGALYESCNDQMPDAIDAYQRAAQLDSNNAHINRRLAEIKRHQDTGGALGPPPSPRDMSHTSANWPFPNALNGTPEQNFGPIGQSDDPVRAAGSAPGALSPIANTNSSATRPPSPLPARPNGARPGTATSSIAMRPQSAGSMAHGPPPQSGAHGIPHPSASHFPHGHSHPIGPPHAGSQTSTIHRRQSGGYGPLAPMDIEPPSHMIGRGPPSAQHNLPHIRSVVDSQSRGPSPAPGPENLRRALGTTGPGAREIASPRTSPSIRPGAGPHERSAYTSNPAGVPHGHGHPGPPPVYSRYPPSQPMDDAPAASLSSGGANLRDRERERVSRESARFRHHSPDGRGTPSERGARSPQVHHPASHNTYPSRGGDYGGGGYPLPPQPQHQSPYDPRHASPVHRGASAAPPRFSPDATQSPTWHTADHNRSNAGPPPQTHDDRHPPPQAGYSPAHHSQSNHVQASGQHHPHQQPTNRRYDPRYDEPVAHPNRHSLPGEHISPPRPGSANVRSNAEEVGRQKSLAAARQAQPSPTPSAAASEFSATGGNGVGGSRRGPRTKQAHKPEDDPPVAPARRRKANATLNRNVSSAQTGFATQSPPPQPVAEPAPSVPAVKERRERKKLAGAKVRGALKTKMSDSVKGPSPSPVPTLPLDASSARPPPPTPSPPSASLPDRKVDEEFDEYDEVADALLSFAGQPPRRMLPPQPPAAQSPRQSQGSQSSHSGQAQVPRITHSKQSSGTRSARHSGGGSVLSPHSDKSLSGGGANSGAGSRRSPSTSSHSAAHRSVMGSPNNVDSPDSASLQPPHLGHAYANQTHYNHGATIGTENHGHTQHPSQSSAHLPTFSAHPPSFSKRVRGDDSSPSDPDAKRPRSAARLGRMPSPLERVPPTNGAGSLGSAHSVPERRISHGYKRSTDSSGHGSSGGAAPVHGQSRAGSTLAATSTDGRGSSYVKPERALEPMAVDERGTEDPKTTDQDGEMDMIEDDDQDTSEGRHRGVAPQRGEEEEREEEGGGEDRAAEQAVVSEGEEEEEAMEEEAEEGEEEEAEEEEEEMEVDNDEDEDEEVVEGDEGDEMVQSAASGTVHGGDEMN